MMTETAENGVRSRRRADLADGVPGQRRLFFIVIKNLFLTLVTLNGI